MTHSASTWAEALPAIAPIFQAHCDEHHMPGCAFGIVAGGELVLAGSIGAINPGGTAAPGAETVYRIASMTKCFGALAILMLRDEGKLALDAPAAEYAPELSGLHYPTRDSNPITVRQLLTMSAGWPEDNPWGDRQLWRSDAQLIELLQAGVSFANAPGVTFEYSNLSYMVLGRIISQVSGESSLSFITRRILRPLGMHDTVWNLDDVDPTRLARGYHWLDGQWVDEPLLPSGGDAAVFAGLYSSVADLARWVSFQLQAWPPGDEKGEGIARRTTLREMQQPQRIYLPANEPPELGRPITWTAGGYGFGLSITYEGKLCIVSHAGGLPGYGSHMGWLPDYDLGVIALGNVRYAGMRQAATGALRRLVEQGFARPRPVRAAAVLETACQNATRLLAAWDANLAEALFADNFFLDNSRERWQAELDRLRTRHGALQPSGQIEAENALRGTWKLEGERGWVRGFLTLTPNVPPRVQELSFASVLPPGPGLQEKLERLIDLANKPSRRAVERLFARQPGEASEQHTFYDKIRLVSALCGRCHLGEIVAGDGERTVRLQLEGTKATVEAELTLDADGRKFAAARFWQVR
jgi:CubicO group peptidase (beta-lactamase class C family)